MTWDVDLFHAINGLAGRSESVDAVMLLLADPQTLLVPVALVVGYWIWIARREGVIGGLALGAVVLVADFIGAQVKHVVDRPRPCVILEQIHQLVGCGKTSSFPSNHALNAAAAAAFAQVLYPASGWVTWPIVALMGFSRVYIGAHFVTDVLGGYAIGALLGIGAALALLRWPGFRTAPQGLGARRTG